MCDGQASNDPMQRHCALVLLGLLGNVTKDAKPWPAFIECLYYSGHMTDALHMLIIPFVLHN